MINNKKNIGLYFYRGYYENYFGKEGLLAKGDKEQLEKAKEKNSSITKVTDLSANNYFFIDTAYKFPLKTVYPGLYSGSGYTFGAGLNGEFQTGFLFDHTTGLPYLPGTSVKGAVRSVFPNYKGGKIAKNTKNREERSNYIWDEYLSKMDITTCFTSNFTKDEDRETVVKMIEFEIFEGRYFEKVIKKEEQSENKTEEKYLSIYNRDIFYDAYILKPVLTGSTKNKFLGSDYITPHKDPLKNPIPLPFLKILPEVTIQFNFDLKTGYYLTAKGKKELFKRILLDFGIGAKTNVGYGQFSE